MLDSDFAAAIQALPADVDGQIQTIIKLALVQGGFEFKPQSKPLGPRYNSLEEVAELEKLLELPPMVLKDLQTIVKTALRKKNLGYRVSRPEQVFFDMLPAEDDDDEGDD